MCRRVRAMTLRLKLVSGCRRAARLTLRLLAWVPVLLVTLVLIWGYYVYVYVMNISGKWLLFIYLVQASYLSHT